jgi:hypothetical protein
VKSRARGSAKSQDNERRDSWFSQAIGCPNSLQEREQSSCAARISAQRLRHTAGLGVDTRTSTRLNLKHFAIAKIPKYYFGERRNCIKHSLVPPHQSLKLYPSKIYRNVLVNVDSQYQWARNIITAASFTYLVDDCRDEPLFVLLEFGFVERDVDEVWWNCFMRTGTLRSSM